MIITTKRLFGGIILLSSSCLLVGCFSSTQEVKLSSEDAIEQTADLSWRCEEQFPNGKPAKLFLHMN